MRDLIVLHTGRDGYAVWVRPEAIVLIQPQQTADGNQTYIALFGGNYVCVRDTPEQVAYLVKHGEEEGA